MNAGSTLACDRCGKANPAHGLWCRTCGMPLGKPGHSAGTAPQPDATLVQQIALYGRVLEDLDAAAREGELPAETFYAIENFYRNRLANKQSQAEQLQRAAGLQKFVDAARGLAHSPSGRFSEAIHTLQEGLKKFPQEQVLAAMLAEIRGRVQQQERAQQAAKQARELFFDAQACLRGGRLDEAQVKLQEALKFAPQNKEILAALERVQGLLDEDRRREQAPEAPASVPGTDADLTTEVVDALVVDALMVDVASVSVAAAPTVERPILIKTSAESAAQARKPIAPTFAEEEIPNPAQRWVEAASEWSKMLKPFLLDNVGWFIGVFLIIAGFVVLITTFWKNIEENRLLMLSLVYLSLFLTTGMIFALAYFLRVKHPELETSSNVLLIIVALLIPLVFAAAALTTLLPAT